MPGVGEGPSLTEKDLGGGTSKRGGKMPEVTKEPEHTSGSLAVERHFDELVVKGEKERQVQAKGIVDRLREQLAQEGEVSLFSGAVTLSDGERQAALGELGKIGEAGLAVVGQVVGLLDKVIGMYSQEEQLEKREREELDRIKAELIGMFAKSLGLEEEELRKRTEGGSTGSVENIKSLTEGITRESLIATLGDTSFKTADLLMKAILESLAGK